MFHCCKRKASWQKTSVQTERVNFWRNDGSNRCKDRIHTFTTAHAPLKRVRGLVRGQSLRKQPQWVWCKQVIILLSGVQTLTYQLSANTWSIHLYFLACCDDEYGAWEQCFSSENEPYSASHDPSSKAGMLSGQKADRKTIFLTLLSCVKLFLQ